MRIIPLTIVRNRWLSFGLRFWAIMACLAVLAGCAAPQTRAVLDGRAETMALPDAASVAGVPFHAQSRDDCGPAASAMVLNWAGVSIDPETIAPQVYTAERGGTLRSDVVTAMRRHGRLAVPVATLEHMLEELAAGHPVLVFQNLGLAFAPQWHFAVAVGYDLDERVVELHTDTRERARVSLDTFERTWVRGGSWAKVVLPPDQLPARRDVAHLVRAAAGIERSGEVADAEAAYRAIIGHFPADHLAWFGLGNSLYAQDRIDDAADAFQRAVEAEHGNANAWHNLAIVLDQIGRRDEALSAAEQAVSLGGERTETYRETLHRLSDHREAPES